MGVVPKYHSMALPCDRLVEKANYRNKRVQMIDPIECVIGKVFGGLVPTMHVIRQQRCLVINGKIVANDQTPTR